MISETRTTFLLVTMTLGSMAASVCSGNASQPDPILARCLHERAVQLADEGHWRGRARNAGRADGTALLKITCNRAKALIS